MSRLVMKNIGYIVKELKAFHDAVQVDADVSELLEKKKKAGDAIAHLVEIAAPNEDIGYQQTSASVGKRTQPGVQCDD